MNNKSEHINELASALSKAQSEIKTAKKTSDNPYFKSKYADLTEVWEAARDAICKNGLAVCHTMGKEDGQLMLFTTLMHSSGQWIKSCFPLICKKPDDIQAMASAVTYSKRYSLAAILCICTDDDDDGNQANEPVKQIRETKKQEEPKKPVFKLSPEEREALIINLGDILEDCGSEYEDKILSHYKIKNIAGIPDDSLNPVINKALAFREIKAKQNEAKEG